MKDCCQNCKWSNMVPSKPSYCTVKDKVVKSDGKCKSYKLMEYDWLQDGVTYWYFEGKQCYWRIYRGAPIDVLYVKAGNAYRSFVDAMINRRLYEKKESR